ncbi:MAG: DUF1156 domain-containing protein [Candidatus Hydrogenedentes bacterium]|nr:DUF1156 domain-containing protein [Candidatus Hydrogenedentota bacterium]
MAIKSARKLIEVALPLDDINDESGKEKSIRHGHPSTIHPWWASRSLAAARAVLFAQLVNDPGGERGWYKGRTKEEADRERERLFDIIRRLVKWDNSSNEAVIEEARQEIQKSWRETCEQNGLPAETSLQFIDPFNGRGYLPLEAQRLGLKTFSSDLNPVAVLIGKSLIELPSKFLGRKPIGPTNLMPPTTNRLDDWPGAMGLAEDIRRFGSLMQKIASERVQSIFPDVTLPAEKGGGTATVLAWLWARTIPSPNPAAGGTPVPLVSSFTVSDVSGREAWVEPIISGNSYSFRVHDGKLPKGEMTSTKHGRASFRCLLTNSPIPLDHIKEMGKAGKMAARLLAIVAEKDGVRHYISPTPEHEQIALSYVHSWRPSDRLSTHPQYMGPPRYGMNTFGDIYTERQLAALDALCVALGDVRTALVECGADDEYARAILTYLGMTVSKCSDYWSTLTTWMPRGTVGHVFATHVIPMTWDYPEANPFSDFHCSWSKSIDWVAKVIDRTYPNLPESKVFHKDARYTFFENKVVSTDPPYYDNVPYADISDYFYIWLRRGLKDVHPDLFGSIQTPKQDELVADVQRWGGEANDYFMNGMTDVMSRIARESSPYFPVTIYYAFKQSETNDISSASRGWEAFLAAVINSGFQITGTWPIRTERGARSRARDSNALASSIVLVCRPRDSKAQTISRREFVRALKDELPETVEAMIGGVVGASPIAPVDLAQAAIGPGMGVFSRYAAVLEADGGVMTVHTALSLINKALDEYFSDAEGEMDSDSRFCVQWFEENGWAAGLFGNADVLARAKGTSVDSVRDAGVLESGSGRVRLLRVSEYPGDWAPEQDNKTPIWEATHQLIRALQNDGESAAGALLARMPARAEPIRQLAYRMYTTCERKGWAEDARSYNELITAWYEIERASHDIGHYGSQVKLDI